MVSGGKVFTSTEGVQYLLDKYLTDGDKDRLRNINTEYSKHRFGEELVNILTRRSGGKRFVPSNYEDELITNSSAIIGTNGRREKLKNGREVTVYNTRNNKNVYEDKKGNIRHYETGRFVKKTVFEE